MRKPGPRGKLRFAVALVGVLDLAVIFLGTYPRTAKWFKPAWSLGSLGVITFLGVFMLENFINTLQQGGRSEVRNAITATFMIVYFALLGLVLYSGDQSVSDTGKTLVGNFTYLVGIVVIFYFGSKAVLDYTSRGGGGGGSGSPQAGQDETDGTPASKPVGPPTAGTE